MSRLSESDINKDVILSGWLHRKRDHGNLLFIDLRDHYGITQCVIENDNKLFNTLEKIKPETVLKINGQVVKRAKGTENLILKLERLKLKLNLLKFYQTLKSYPYQFLEIKNTPKS